MAVTKRTGPNFLFLANTNSRKFDDIEKHRDTVTSTSKTAATRTGFQSQLATTTRGSKRHGRMKLVEIQSISAIVTGGVAQTGPLRQMEEDEIKQARSTHSNMRS
ncbi:hypothetical protein LTR17_002088 [Elasticomyces elasticus]|nr:hypothetical protein LTR17_002088 [Elasticomyces elasticus]